MNEADGPIHIVVVGDPFVGKTCLIFNYAKDEFLTKPVTTVADEYDISDIQYMGQKVKLSVWDLSGKDQHRGLRDFVYSKADAVIFCFSLAQCALEGQDEGKIVAGASANTATLSLMSVKNKWLPEITKQLGDSKKQVVKILVGTKSDQLFVNLMPGESKEAAQAEIDRAADMMISANLVNYYFKTSSLFGSNVKNVFDQAIMSVLQ